MTFYYECDRCYYKMRQKFIAKCARFFITKCVSFILKYDNFITKYLQNVTFITNCDSITKFFPRLLLHFLQRDKWRLNFHSGKFWITQKMLPRGLGDLVWTGIKRGEITCNLIFSVTLKLWMRVYKFENPQICGALRDLVLFVQFKKREKHPWGSVNFSKVLILIAEACNFTKINTPLWVFITFFKLYKWYQIAQCTTFKQFHFYQTTFLNFDLKRFIVNWVFYNQAWSFFLTWKLVNGNSLFAVFQSFIFLFE